MSAPGPVMEMLGRAAYEFSLIQPYIPTYLHLLLSALFPIFTGSHASLSRPASADRPKRRKTLENESGNERDLQEGEVQRMEGLTPSDAIVYPLLAGSMLAGLYFLLKWLDDPEIMNTILNWYLSIFGTFSIQKLVSDSMDTTMSFIFPARFADSGTVWEVKRKQRLVSPRQLRRSEKSPAISCTTRTSPLPGTLSRISLRPSVSHFLWVLKDAPTKPFLVIGIYVKSIVEGTVNISLQGILSLVSAVSAVLYFNLVDKPWWLTNLLGFSFSYSALQLMSPTTFWTGTLVLSSLFFYDIYFVFFTPLMITVATKLDIPIKLLFPRPPGNDEDPSKKALSMLGLGDVVLPGIMIGLALRFDLYMFYLRKQKARTISEKQSVEIEIIPSKDLSTKDKLAEDNIKAEYRSATGAWGERFWLGSKEARKAEGGSFPKVYFYSSITGYVIGMLCTLGVMHVFQHGQPALLYSVPAVLTSLWGTAFVRGDIKIMWEYSEATEEEAMKPKEESTVQNKIEDKPKASEILKSREPEGGKPSSKGAQEDGEQMEEVGSIEKVPSTENMASSLRLISFSVSLPRREMLNSSTTNDPKQRMKKTRSLEDELRRASESNLAESDPTESTSSSTGSTPLRRTSSDLGGEPAGKRRRKGLEDHQFENA